MYQLKQWRRQAVRQRPQAVQRAGSIRARRVQKLIFSISIAPA